jgi:hypothetical protein
MNDTPWIKASASDGQGQCVEMRRHDGLVEVRDSKDPQGPVLRFRAAGFAAWLAAARSGALDHLS